MLLALLLISTMLFTACTNVPPLTESTTIADSQQHTDIDNTSSEETNIDVTEESLDIESTEENTIELTTENESTIEDETIPNESTIEDNLKETFNQFANGNFEGTTLTPVNYMKTGVIPKIETVAPEIIGEKEIAQMDRSMRAYKKTVDDTLIVNEAPSFFFYNQFNADQRAIYDAMLQLAQDPTNSDNIVTLKTKRDVTSDDFVLDYYTVWLSLTYDHPELWWMYYWNGTIQFDAFYGEDNNTLYLQFTTPYDAKQFNKDLAAFNEATQEIIDSIDTTQSDKDILRDVHDQIIELGTYDYDILNEGKNDFGHTAFGCFVRNSSGTPNYCVCDGYSQAYLYILQQLGFYGTVVLGNAGDAGADGGMGGHAWSLIQSDGIWYEVDTTWDDYTDFLASVEEQYGKNSIEYAVYSEMFSDKKFVNRLQHHMFMIKTAEISDYVPSSNLIYTTKDGQYQVSMVGESQRVRYCDDDQFNGSPQEKLTSYLPIADGKKHKDAFYRDEDNSNFGNDDNDIDETEIEEDDTEVEETDDWDDWNWNDDEDETEAETKKETQSSNTRLPNIKGLYYVSGFGGMNQAMLERYYGKNYWQSLSMFEIKTENTGLIYNYGMQIPFKYQFDGENLLMVSSLGEQIYMQYNDGDFIMYDIYGYEFIYSLMK